MVQRIQEAAPAVATGATTAIFGALSDLATIAEQVGMIAGCGLTLWFVYKEIRNARKGK